MSKSSSNNANFVRVMIIVILTAIMIVGNFDVTLTEGLEEGEIIPTLTRIEEGSVRDDLGYILKDFTTYCLNFNKLKAFGINKEIKTRTLPHIESLKGQVSDLKAREQLLERTINSLPNSEYIHSKMELSSFIVEELKDKELIYEIGYNYMREEEEEDNKEEVVTRYSNTFKITIYKINEEGNYERLMQVLENIFIKEPYEIKNLNMEYNELTGSYTLSFVIEV